MAQNRPKAQNKYTVQNILNYSYDENYEVLVFAPLAYNPTSDNFSAAYPANALNLKPYDYVARVLTNSTTETYTFKSGGSGGTTTNTVVIVYTDTSLNTISIVTKT